MEENRRALIPKLREELLLARLVVRAEARSEAFWKLVRVLAVRATREVRVE